MVVGYLDSLKNFSKNSNMYYNPSNGEYNLKMHIVRVCVCVCVRACVRVCVTVYEINSNRIHKQNIDTHDAIMPC